MKYISTRFSLCQGTRSTILTIPSTPPRSGVEPAALPRKRCFLLFGRYRTGKGHSALVVPADRGAAHDGHHEHGRPAQACVAGDNLARRQGKVSTRWHGAACLAAFVVSPCQTLKARSFFFLFFLPKAVIETLWSSSFPSPAWPALCAVQTSSYTSRCIYSVRT